MPGLPGAACPDAAAQRHDATGLQVPLRSVGFDLEQLLATRGERLHEERVIHGTTCYSHADVLERLEDLARDLFGDLERHGFDETVVTSGQMRVLGRVVADAVPQLQFACRALVPALEQVTDEIDHVLDALEGRYVPAGPAGAPTRGMAHVLPTGRNFYAVDPRAVPSQAAWRVGQQLAREVAERHRTETGRYPEMVGLGAWEHRDGGLGTILRRSSRCWGRTSVGLPLATRSRSRADSLDRLSRPRIDVTRISGFSETPFLI